MFVSAVRHSDWVILYVLLGLPKYGCHVPPCSAVVTISLTIELVFFLDVVYQA